MIQNLLKSAKYVLSRVKIKQLPKLSLIQTQNMIANSKPNSNLRKLYVYNSFTKIKEPSTANGRFIYIANNESEKLQFAKAYICGPTVYDESHIGHAMTYLRFDLIRRVLKRYCSVDLVSIINITDIDDKIINKSLAENKTFTEISKFYLASFLKDLHTLNILPFNAYVPVTAQMDNIIEYIKILEEKGYAYFNEVTGDIDLDTSKIDQELSNFKTDTILPGRRSEADFTLWKAHKANEPFWNYKSEMTNKLIKGRPGWHVECSVINNSILGNKIDFHFGGNDLLFPHHVNESRCCKAYNYVLESNLEDQSSSNDGIKSIDTDFPNQGLVKQDDRLSNQPIHKWSNSWLHFGKLIINNEKMSKSLNNYIQIKKFLRKHSKNTLRLLCIIHPYRRDITYDEGNLEKVNDYNSKILNFYQTLNNQKNELIYKSKLKFGETEDLKKLINSFIESNLDGIANDFNLSDGWSKFIELISFVHKNIELCTIYDLIKLELVVSDYLNTLGLVYHGDSLSRNRNPNDQHIIRKFTDYRKEVRKLVLEEKIDCGNKSEKLDLILKLTDNIRDSLANNHLIIRDDKFLSNKKDKK